MIITLGIETSCDETSAAVYHERDGLLSNVIFSQIELHKGFGGVMPELASRSQLEKITPVIQEALEKAACTLNDITTVAVTNCPGLPGSLLVGVCFAKAYAFAGNKRLIGVNHLEGHVFSALVEHNVPFPYLCLTASGGHTALYLVRGWGDFELLGQTRDDAAGEAFDKVGKLLGLPYPGGPEIERYAKAIGFKDFANYPRGKMRNLEFSFSGLKTAVLYDLVKRDAYDMASRQFLKPEDEQLKQEVASSLLVCIGDIFCNKLEEALALIKHVTPVQAVAFVGGVACNRYLRERIKSLCDAHKLSFFVPSAPICTDNGAMIAIVGTHKDRANLQENKINHDDKTNNDANNTNDWSLDIRYR